MKIIVINSISLDGVFQAPGRVDEDTRGDFEHGGWASRHSNDSPDPEIGSAMGQRMSQSDGLLFGRRTYVDLMTTWNARGGMFKDALNAAQKYVVSRTLTDRQLWPNSHLIEDDPVEAIRNIRARPGREIHIMGSGQLIDSLIPLGLIDEFMLLIHPVVLGSGRHLFAESTYGELTLVSALSTQSGVIVATYRTKLARVSTTNN
jgi:dihydrofolate reductase